MDCPRLGNKLKSSIFLILLVIGAVFLLGFGVVFYKPIRERARFYIFRYKFKKNRQEKLKTVLDTKYYAEAKVEALEWSQEAKIGRFGVLFHELEDETPGLTYTFVDPYTKKTLRFGFDSKGKMKKEERVNDLNTQKMMKDFPVSLSANEAKEIGLEKAKEMTDKEISYFSLDLNGKLNYWEFKATIVSDDKENKEIYCRVYFDSKIECNPFGDKLIWNPEMKKETD